MDNTKLIKVLKTFSKTEIARFEDFVNSPYYNKNQNVRKVCVAVLNYYPGFDSKDFTEENIYTSVFKKEKYDYFKLKNILSDLFSVVNFIFKINLI